MATSKNSYGWTTPDPVQEQEQRRQSAISGVSATGQDTYAYSPDGRPTSPTVQSAGAANQDYPSSQYQGQPSYTQYESDPGSGGKEPWDAGYSEQPPFYNPYTYDNNYEPYDSGFSERPPVTYPRVPPPGEGGYPNPYDAGTSGDFRGNRNSWGENWYWPGVAANQAAQDSETNAALGWAAQDEGVRASMEREKNEANQLAMAYEQWFGVSGAQAQAWASMDIESDRDKMGYDATMSGYQSAEEMAAARNALEQNMFRASEARAGYEYGTSMGEGRRQFDATEAEKQRQFNSLYRQESEQFGATLANQQNQFTRGLNQQGYEFDTTEMRMHQDMMQQYGLDTRGMDVTETESAAKIADMLHSQGIDTRGMTLAELQETNRQAESGRDFGEGQRQFNVQAGLSERDLSRQESDTASIIEQRLHQAGIDTRGMNLAELKQADAMQEQEFRQGFDVTQADRAYGIEQGRLDISQQLADLQGAKTGAEVDQIKAQIDDMLFQQGIDSRGMGVQETLAASTIADRLAKQGIDIRGMSLAELQREDAYQNQMFQQGFQVTELGQRADLAREGMRSAELQSRYGAFGRAQGPNTQFLRNW